MGSKINDVNRTHSVINAQESGPSPRFSHPPPNSYVDALLASSPSTSPFLSKNSTPSPTSESSSRTKV